MPDDEPVPPDDTEPLEKNVNKGDGPLSKEQVRRAEQGPSRRPYRPSLVKSLWYFAMANLTLALFAITGSFVWGFAVHSIINFWHWGWDLVS
jgi:hypothetical protein